MNECQRFEEILVKPRKERSAWEEAFLVAHMELCNQCGQLLRAEGEMEGSLSQLTATSPPAYLAERIVGSLIREARLSEHKSSVTWWEKLSWLSVGLGDGLAWGASATVAFLLLGKLLIYWLGYGDVVTDFFANLGFKIGAIFTFLG